MIKYLYHSMIYLLVWFALSLDMTPLSAQTEVTVYYPVSGSFVRARIIEQPAPQLGIVDTFNTAWTPIQVPYSRTSRPRWSPDGESVAYKIIGIGAPSAVHNITSGLDTFTTASLTNVLTPFDLTDVMGWGNTSETLLIEYAQILDGLTSNLVLYDVNTVTNVSQEIHRWQTSVTTPDANIPLPPNVTEVKLEGTRYIQRNPVFDDWLWIHFSARGFYSTFDSSEPSRADINVLWNFRTNEYISLNALVPDLWFSARFMDWSHDGTRLVLYAVSQDLQNSYIVSFHFTPDQGVTLIDRAVVENRTPQHWLDAGSLFFSIVQNYEGGAAYVLGEIVDGEYRETPFFTLNGEQFQRESLGDWFMRADNAERDRLSCLFEWSLPTQLAIGDNPEVVSAEGLTLHSRPDRFSSAVQTLSQGTVVTIIGGEACSDGYRWWPVRLSDGTEGFVAEASTDEYFIEPVAKTSP